MRRRDTSRAGHKRAQRFHSRMIGLPGRMFDDMNTQPAASSTAARPGARSLTTASTRSGRSHRRRMLRTDLLTVIAWASVAAAVALWLADGGASGFSITRRSFTASGIVAGLAGMDLVLLMLLLAARIPFIDAHRRPRPGPGVPPQTR